MKTMLKLGLGFCVVLALTALPGCAYLKWPFGQTEAAPVATAPERTVDCEAELRAIINDHIKAAASGEQENRARLVRKQPYYYREYEVYPDGANAFKVVMQKTESRSNQYSAEVNITKIRYATRLRKDKGEAQQDTSFLRGTGTETITYEFRNGRWIRIGSLFVANRTDEHVNGEWLPLREEAQYSTPKDTEEGPQRSWWRQSWFWLTGK